MAKKKTMKGGLGKGLDLLIPGAETKEEKKEALLLKTSQLEPNKDQPRKKFDEEAIEELAQSIKQYGIIQPIIVCKKDDYYQIIAGERRWRAAKKAGIREVPVVVKEYTDKEIAEISLIENIQREDLNPIEEAKSYKRLIDEYKLTQEELSERVSKSRTEIANKMRLLKLHDEVQKMLISGALSAGHARALLGLESKKDQLKAANEIIEKSLSVRQTEDLVKKMNEPKKDKTAKGKEADSLDFVYRDLEKKLSDCLGTKVRISRKDKNKGKIEINYYSEDELDRLYGIINKGAK
ncbi:MAG: ParB/RepB/Spo0J family partition protein [Lachnospiraceae bacterium]|nr:ParB/RepB/Spo0J family partition protein [Lachnospiraceae bacterium]MDO4528813.1 ParB/RepB/Spo0J family partition protein [Lachnospiraceae bacterium]